MRTQSPSPSSPNASFDVIIRAELPVLYRVARRLVLNGSDAEDLVSQTLYKAARAWSTFDGRHVRSWLIQILNNEHLGMLRTRRRHPESPIDDIVEPSDEGFWEEISWSMVGQDLLAELDRLPEEYRLAIALCDVEEMGYDDAARALGVPVGTIRSRLFRGRRLLRARLVHLYPVGESQ